MIELISNLGLSRRSRKCIDRLGITTIGELCSLSEEELLSVKNFGPTSLYEVKNILEERGLALGCKSDVYETAKAKLDLAIAKARVRYEQKRVEALAEYEREKSDALAEYQRVKVGE